MNCAICKHGDTRPGTVTAAFDLPGGCTVVFQGVPAQVCDNCGEKYFDEATTSQLLRQAKLASGAGTQVQIQPYAAE